MDFDKIFKNNNMEGFNNIDALNKHFFYTNYSGAKIMVGKISLENALARMSKNEFYTLVTYTKDDILPEEYIAMPELKSEDGTLYATLNPNRRFNYICANGGIQMISRLPSLENGGPRYLLGPGPNEVDLLDVVVELHNRYSKLETNDIRRGR